MIKYIGGLKRPPSMTVEEFNKWWLGPHSAKGRRVPGLKKYVISLAIPESSTLLFPAKNVSDEKPQYGGTAELWFDSVDDLRMALASSVWEEIRNDGREHKIIPGMLMATEEHVII